MCVSVIQSLLFLSLLCFEIHYLILLSVCNILDMLIYEIGIVHVSSIEMYHWKLVHSDLVFLTLVLCSLLTPFTRILFDSNYLSQSFDSIRYAVL